MWTLVCLIVAVVIFLVAAFVTAPIRVNLTALGLAFFALPTSTCPCHE